jgi:hypothetical protein
MILYHGTSEKNAKEIVKNGFVPDKTYNWSVKSRKGLVYLSLGYAPFYAMSAKKSGNRGALIKVEVPDDCLIAEDDFIMYALKKPKYTQKDLDKVDKILFLIPENVQASLKFMGNCAARPEDIKILGVTYFDMEHLVHACDPVISPLNYKIMGDYYRRLTEWMYDGKDPLEFAQNYYEKIHEQIQNLPRGGVRP